MPETKGSYAWDKSKASVPKAKSPMSSRRRSPGRNDSDARRKSSRRRSSRRSRRSKDRRRSSRESRSSREYRQRPSKKSRGRRRSSQRKSRDRRKSESPRREDSQRMTNPPEDPPKRSISKVKVWQVDKRFSKGNSNNKKSWQAVPPTPADTNNQIKNRKSRPSQNQAMMEQQRRLTPALNNTNFNTIEEDEEDDDSDSDDPLNLPKNPEIYMYQQLPLEPEVKKFRPGCTCSAAGRLSCWCKLLAYLEIFVGINLVIFKVTVILTHPVRQQVREVGETVDSLELAAYSVITFGGLILLMGAGCRLKMFCLLHVIMVLLGMLTMIVTIVLYMLYKVPIESEEPELDGVWWFLEFVKICWLWLLLWSALLSLLLFLRIRQTDRMNVVKPMEFTVSPQTYMSKVEIFLNV
ncbi:unnamed protein product [Allacma fusca]|uniref:Uncharacterized protein n=1 Tax=Allacma fusca TaxID=39272 RepID=A0A8J2KHC1_9HEXA|nr:unnamed protein product [Allacma fusca]